MGYVTHASFTLECRKQNKNTITNCGNSVEHEKRRNGQSDSRIIETDNINTSNPTERMLERILYKDNMNNAYLKVKANRGAGGVDKMEIDELLEHLKTYREEILTSLLKGSYKPHPVKRVEIPKENGKTRKLGIPTLIDRVIQQAILQDRKHGNGLIQEKATGIQPIAGFLQQP